MNKEISLFDCNAMLGIGPENEGSSFDTVSDLKKSMEIYCIDKALVYSALAKHYRPVEGNSLLGEQVKGPGNIYKSWVVLPGYTGEFLSGKELATAMKADNVVAARLCPVVFNVQLSPWACDDLMGVLNDLHMPLFLDFNVTHWSNVLPWDAIRNLCLAYPNIPIILNRIGCGYNRILFPLLNECPNLHFEISYFNAHNGIEAVTKNFGASRMLFGTDAPVHNPACPIGLLYFADIAYEDKVKIGRENLEKLIGDLQYV